ncbi:MAG: TonB family protein [Bacteroidia bacterium]|nr:TonB family protein [Bacteroidia bacterium]
METFASYLLKSAVWLTGFSLIYFMFLRNERFFRIKRVYLVTGILASFIFPLISLHYKLEMPAPQATVHDLIPSVTQNYPVNESVPGHKTLDYRYILLFLYVTGIILLASRTFRQMRTLSVIIKKTGVSSRGPAKIVKAAGISSSFSFFNYVFISPSVKEPEAGQILNHEEVHVSQKHWFDLLLAELLRIFQWANPFAWIYAGFIKQNHEYLADEAALERTANPADYRATLMNQIFKAPVISLSNSYSYSNNKKRFDMMKKTDTSPYRKLKVFLILPVFAIIFYAFATPEYNSLSPTDNETAIAENISGIVKNIKGIVLKEDGTPLTGAAILVAGTKIRATTDVSGNFSLAEVPEDAFIVFSCRGYLTQFLKADFVSTMTVKLLKDLDYIEPQIDFISGRQEPSAISSKINETGNNMAGALIMIDGKESSRDALNKSMGNIESVSVLKGVSATKVFGDKGKNGAIVVTLKKNVSLKPQESAPTQTQQTQQQRPEPLVVVDEVITAKTYREVMNEIRDQIGVMKTLRPNEAQEKYGEKGKFGAMEIITIAKAKELGIKIPFRRKNPEDYPTFQGSNFGSFPEWVAGQIKYPPESTAKGSQGFASAEFTIEADGSVTNVKASSVPDQFIGEALVKAIQSSPKWEPAKNPEANEPFKTSATVGFELPDRVTIDNVPFVVVEQMPNFPGGDAALLQYIAENTHYPDSAKANNIQGRVIVRFAISNTGKVGNISVLKGVNPLLDEEAIRVTKTLPDFTPGYQGGKPVSVWYMIPITFTLK